MRKNKGPIKDQTLRDPSSGYHHFRNVRENLSVLTEFFRSNKSGTSIINYATNSKIACSVER